VQLLLRLKRQGLPLRVWWRRNNFPSVIATGCRVTVQENQARQKLPATARWALVVRGTGVERGCSGSVQCQSFDVFAAESGDRFSRCDPHGKLAAGGRSARWRWPELVAGAKPCQLARNDRRPKRWVVLQRNTKAWGLVLGQAADASLPQELLRPYAINFHNRVPPSSAVLTPEGGLKLVLQSASETSLPEKASQQRFGCSCFLPAVLCLWSSAGLFC